MSRTVTDLSQGLGSVFPPRMSERPLAATEEQKAAVL
jgi:hypothetical protein